MAAFMSVSASASLFEKTLEEQIAKTNEYIFQVREIIHILAVPGICRMQARKAGTSTMDLAEMMFDLLRTLTHHRHQLERMRQSFMMNSRQN